MYVTVFFYSFFHTLFFSELPFSLQPNLNKPICAEVNTTYFQQTHRLKYDFIHTKSGKLATESLLFAESFSLLKLEHRHLLLFYLLLHRAKNFGVLN